MDPPELAPPDEPTPEPTTLGEAGETTGRLVGVALQARLLSDDAYTAVAREFSSLTAENEMKWQSLEPQPNQFNFGQADRIMTSPRQTAFRYVATRSCGIRSYPVGSKT